MITIFQILYTLFACNKLLLFFFFFKKMLHMNSFFGQVEEVRQAIEQKVDIHLKSKVRLYKMKATYETEFHS